MQKIHYPKWLSINYYENTIKYNRNVTLDGFYKGTKNEAYKKSREELRNNYELTYVCDYWLDGFCWQDCYSFYHVPDTRILKLIEKYYEETIPLGCFIIAVKHRGEKHVMSTDGLGFDLIIKKKAFFDYLELYEK